jgi:hypothetical protein
MCCLALLLLHDDDEDDGDDDGDDDDDDEDDGDDDGEDDDDDDDDDDADESKMFICGSEINACLVRRHHWIETSFSPAPMMMFVLLYLY